MSIINQKAETTPANENSNFTGEETSSSPAAEKTELEQVREELASERDARLRLAAEYENYRRRTKRELADAGEAGKRELLEQLVSLADDFALALANADDASDQKIVEGLQLIERRLKDILEANEVVPFTSAGEFFNPELHEAFDVAPARKGKSGRIYSELRRGYFWRDKLLRPALVVVAR